MVSHFTPELLQAMDDALGKEEQIILFQTEEVSLHIFNVLNAVGSRSVFNALST